LSSAGRAHTFAALSLKHNGYDYGEQNGAGADHEKRCGARSTARDATELTWAQFERAARTGTRSNVRNPDTYEREPGTCNCSQGGDADRESLYCKEDRDCRQRHEE
jgi:hypothetical protein